MGYPTEAEAAAAAEPTAQDAAAARVAVRLARDVTVTWWYTFSTVLFFIVMLVPLWAVTTLVVGRGDGPAIAIGVGGVAWVAATIMLLVDYRARDESAPMLPRGRMLVALALSAGYSVLVALASGIWVAAAVPMLEALVLLNWGPGIRRRVVLGATVLLGALWAIDVRFTFPADGFSTWFLVGFYSASLPALTVLTLWWWDIVVTLDRARASEARLAATQERLRVATDVHDLQGHHLQVIALQLELAERLMEHDPAQALEQVRAARSSVDEARQGTRDLALRFRSVPLRDELANAVDLLRAAGVVADATVDQDADHAPAAVLGPVIREATTNALRHGGGRWARLALTRTAGSWRLEVANDADLGAAAESGAGGGAGLDGIARRAADAGGAVEVRPRDDSFVIVVTVPERTGRS